MTNPRDLSKRHRRHRTWLGSGLCLGVVFAGAPLAIFVAWTSLAACGGSANAGGDAGADAGGDGDSSSDDSSFVVNIDATDAGEASIGDDSGAEDAATFDGNSCELLTCQGTCVAGRCLFAIVPTGDLAGAYDLVVHDDRVYWTSPGTTPGSGSVQSLASSPTATTGGVQVIRSGQTYPHGITVAGNDVYWANDSPTAGSVVGAPLALVGDGGAGATDASAYDAGDGSAGATPVITLATGQASPDGVVSDATNVYWTSAGQTTAANGTVVQYPLAGGASITLASGRSSPSALAVDATYVYWVDTGVGVFGGAVLKVPIGGGTVTTLAAGQNSPEAIAVDSSNVYWTQLGSGSHDSAVAKVPIAGGAVVTVAGNQGVLGGLTVDATTLYWAVGGGNGTGAILSAPLGGNVVTTLVTGLDDPFALATDATSLYWTDSTDGTITKLTPK